MKIILLTTKGSRMGINVINKLHKNKTDFIVLSINPGYKNKSFISSSLIYLKKYGLIMFIKKFTEIIKRKFSKDEVKINTKINPNKISDISNKKWKEIKKVIRQFNPELCICASFRKIIPESIIQIPKNFINIHPSLLPKYRGANPIYWALKNKEKETGITYHFLTKGIDTGNIISQKKYTIQKNDNELKIKKKLAILSAEHLEEVIKKIKNKYKGIKQDDSKASFAPDHK